MCSTTALPSIALRDVTSAEQTEDQRSIFTCYEMEGLECMYSTTALSSIDLRSVTSAGTEQGTILKQI